MHPSKTIWSVVLVAVLYLPSIVRAEDAVAKWIDRLDEAFYYPKRQGLAGVSVRIEWRQSDPARENDSYLKYPEIGFVWDKGGAGRFALSPQTPPMSEEEEREFLSVISNYREVIIPRLLKDKFSSYRGTQLPAKGDEVHLKFEIDDPRETVQKYLLRVDRRKRRLRKFRMLRNQAPRTITSQLLYTERAGKWLVAESRSRFQWDGKAYEDVSEISYQSMEGIWLTRKLTHTIKQDGENAQISVFRFKDYRLKTTGGADKS